MWNRKHLGAKLFWLWITENFDFFGRNQSSCIFRTTRTINKINFIFRSFHTCPSFQSCHSGWKFIEPDVFDLKRPVLWTLVVKSYLRLNVKKMCFAKFSMRNEHYKIDNILLRKLELLNNSTVYCICSLSFW